MAKQRVQVADLQTSTEVRPTISPVETYVRPAEVQSQPNALQQFVAALTPAIKASEDIKLEEKLKRERKIENGVYKSQLAQGEAAATILEAKANKAYTDNPDYFHEMSTADVLAMRKGYQDKYIEQLEEQNVDPNIIQGLRYKLQKSDATFAIAFDEGKSAYQDGKLDSQFSEAVIAVVESGADEVAQHTELEKLQRVYAEANPTVNNKGVQTPDFKRFGNLLLSVADRRKQVDALSPLNSFLNKKKITFTDENFKVGQAIENAAQTQRAGELKKFNKQAVEADKLAAASTWMDSADANAVPMGTITVTKNGHTYNREPKDLAIVIDQEAAQRALTVAQSDLPEDVKNDRLNEIARRRVGFYTANRILPKEVSAAQSNIQYDFKNANFKDEDTLAKFGEAFKSLRQFDQYDGDAFKGMSEDMKYKAQGVLLLTENNFSLQEALFQMQMPPEMGKTIDVDSATVLKAIDNSLLKLTNLDEVVNAGSMTSEVQKLATILAQTNNGKLGSDEQIIRMAVKAVQKNYTATKIGNAVDAKFSAVRLPAASMREAPYLELLDRGFDKILANKQHVNRIHKNLGIVPDTRVVAVGAAAKSQVAQQVFNKPQFTLHYANTGNDNMLRIIAMPIDPSLAAGETYTVSTVNLLDFNEMALKGVAEQAAENLNANIELGLVDETELDDEDYMVPDWVRTPLEQMEAYTPTIQPKGTISPFEAMTRLRSLDRESGQGITAVREVTQTGLDQLKAKALADAKERGVLPEGDEKSWGQQFDSMLDSITTGISDYFAGVEERGKNQEPTTNPLLNLIQDIPAEKALADVAGQVADVVTAVPKGLAAANEALMTPAQASEVTPSETTRTIFTDQTGKAADMTGNTVAEKAGNLIKTQEGFKPNPYKDGKDRSVGYGFYLPALEPDELALIKDVENITEDEANAVMELKTRKISTFLADEITNFEALPEETQLGVISMAYQLGAPNLPSSWPSFMKAIKEAASAPEGSAEQAAALEEAAFNMLYNRKADGSTTKTKWYQQTPNRAEEMAAAVKG